MHLRPPVAQSAVGPKVMILLLIHCLFLLLLWGFCVWSYFCYTVLGSLSCFAIILMGKRVLVALLYLSTCLVTVKVLWLFLTVPWVGLQCVIVVSPYHTHLLLRRFLQQLCFVNMLTSPSDAA